MEISRSNFLQVTFVLTEDYLTKIHRSFVEFANKEDAVSLEIECNDNLNRKFSGIKELLDFENTPSSQIKSLSIKAFVNENDNYRNADLTLYDDKLSNMYINIDGQKEDVLKLNGSIEAYLQGMKPWYSRVTNLDFFKVFLLLFLLSMIVIMCAVWFGLVPISETSSTAETSFKAKTIVALFFILPFVAGVILNWLKSWIFPISYFAIGQGKKRYENTDYIRKFIVGLIVTGIIALLGLLLNLIF